MDFVDLFMTHGPYVAICLVIAFALTAAKKSFPKFFKTPWGLRLLYFAPAVLGAVMGFLLPEDSLKLQLLYGMACGTVSQTLYSIVTKALQSKVNLIAQVEKKGVDLDKYRESLAGEEDA